MDPQDYDITDGVCMGNYARPGSTFTVALTGLVMLERTNYGIGRRMFHPYSGAPPIHCATPAGHRTYHRPQGYS